MDEVLKSRQERLEIRPGFSVKPVQMQSGPCNFDDEGYSHHGLYRTLFPGGFEYRPMTFRSKTVVAYPNTGQMPLVANPEFTLPKYPVVDLSVRDRISMAIESLALKTLGFAVNLAAKDCNPPTWPREAFPKCIKVWLNGTLNAVSLSDTGIRAHLLNGDWQRRKREYWISIMPIKKTAQDRLEEIRFIRRNLEEYRDKLGKFGIEINISCPNEGKEKAAYLAEVYSWLTELGCLGVPVVIKISALENVDTVRNIVEHDSCDGITLPNTLPWGKCGRVDWKRLSHDGISPLVKRGLDPGKPGGYAGPELFDLTIEWLCQGRAAGIKKHICAGGWVTQKHQPKILFDAGADSIAIGDAFIVRPWRLRSISEECYKNVFGDGWQQEFNAAIAGK